MADDLQRFLDNQPIKAKPPTWRELATKWSRRHPTVIWAAALFLLATTIVSAVSAVMISGAYKREAIQRRSAEQQRQRAEAERERTETHFINARITVEKVLAGPAFGRGEWSNLPLEYRKKFALKANDYYGSLLQEGSSNPALKLESAVGYYSLASIHSSFKEYPQAEKLILRSIAILDELRKDDPNEFEYRQQLAWSNYCLGSTSYVQQKFAESDAAIRRTIVLYKSLIQEGPDNKNYLQECYLCYNKLITQKSQIGESTDELRAALLVTAREAVNRQPSYYINQYYLGLALWDNKQFDEAISALREAARLKPDSTAMLRALAWRLVSCPKKNIRDPKAAIELAEKAVKLAPQNGSIWNILGVAHYRAGNWQAAHDALQKSGKIRDGGTSNDNFFLAMSNWQLGNRDAAHECYVKAVERMEKDRPDDAGSKRLRTEAEKLLGIPKSAAHSVN